MKRIIILIVMIASYVNVEAQRFYTDVYSPIRWTYGATSRIFNFPTGAGAPIELPTLRQSAFYYDTIGGIIYYFKPETQIWDTLRAAGGGSGGGGGTGDLAVFPTTTAMELYSGTAKISFVTDPVQGGLFKRYDGSGPALDSFRVFKWGLGGDQISFWLRVADPSQGISLEWAGIVGDGVKNNSSLFKMLARHLPSSVVINGTPGANYLTTPFTWTGITNLIWNGNRSKITIKDSAADYYAGIRVVGVRNGTYVVNDLDVDNSSAHSGTASSNNRWVGMRIASDLDLEFIHNITFNRVRGIGVGRSNGTNVSTNVNANMFELNARSVDIYNTNVKFAGYSSFRVSAINSKVINCSSDSTHQRDLSMQGQFMKLINNASIGATTATTNFPLMQNDSVVLDYQNTKQHVYVTSVVPNGANYDIVFRPALTAAVSNTVLNQPITGSIYIENFTGIHTDTVTDNAAGGLVLDGGANKFRNITVKGLTLEGALASAGLKCRNFENLNISGYTYHLKYGKTIYNPYGIVCDIGPNETVNISDVHLYGVPNFIYAKTVNISNSYVRGVSNSDLPNYGSPTDYAFQIGAPNEVINIVNLTVDSTKFALKHLDAKGLKAVNFTNVMFNGYTGSGAYLINYDTVPPIKTNLTNIMVSENVNQYYINTGSGGNPWQYKLNGEYFAPTKPSASQHGSFKVGDRLWYNTTTGTQIASRCILAGDYLTSQWVDIPVLGPGSVIDIDTGRYIVREKNLTRGRFESYPKQTADANRFFIYSDSATKNHVLEATGFTQNDFGISLRFFANDKYRFTKDGLGIFGVTNPGGQIGFAPVTATAGTAPLVFGASTVVLGVPLARALEPIDTAIYYTYANGTRIRLDKQSGSGVSGRYVDTLYRVNDSTVGFKIAGVSYSFQIKGGTATGGGGAGTNMATADQDATGNRVHNWKDYTFQIDSLKTYSLYSRSQTGTAGNYSAYLMSPTAFSISTANAAGAYASIVSTNNSIELRGSNTGAAKNAIVNASGPNGITIRHSPAGTSHYPTTQFIDTLTLIGTGTGDISDTTFRVALGRQPSDAGSETGVKVYINGERKYGTPADSSFILYRAGNSYKALYMSVADLAAKIGSGSGVPTSRTLTINGVTYDLTNNRSWTISTTGVTTAVLTDTANTLVRLGTNTQSGGFAVSGEGKMGTMKATALTSQPSFPRILVQDTDGTVGYSTLGTDSVTWVSNIGLLTADATAAVYGAVIGFGTYNGFYKYKTSGCGTINDSTILASDRTSGDCWTKVNVGGSASGAGGSYTFGSSDASLSTSGSSSIDHIINLAHKNTFTTDQEVTRASISSTETAGFTLSNATAATNGTQQMAPYQSFKGFGYGTTASTSQSVEARWLMTPVQGTTPTYTMKLGSIINGGTETYPLSITSTGAITALGAVSGTSFSTSGSTGVIGINRSAIAATSTDALNIANATSSTSGVPRQFSGRVRFKGTAWNGSATQDAELIQELRPVNGTSPITSEYYWSGQINAGGYTDLMKLTSAGNLNILAGSLGLTVGSDASYDSYYRGTDGLLKRVAPNTTTTKKYYNMTGTGSAGAAPSYDVIAAADLPSSIDAAKIAGGSVSNGEYNQLDGIGSATIKDQLDTKSDRETTMQTLTDGATITFNVANGTVAQVTLGGNRTLAVTGTTSGKTRFFLLKIIQDGTGGRDLTLPAGWLVGDGNTGTLPLSTAAGAKDIATIFWDGTTYHVNLTKNYN